MTETPIRTETRSIEREILIDAEPEVVWRALTAEIDRWFAPDAVAEGDTNPEVIKIRWDSSNDYQLLHVLDWKPAEHLRTTWRDGPGGEHELPLDIRLQRADGGTVLRLVHSGFLSDASWDDEFDSHGRGWSYELRSLKYYVERQLGKVRRHVLRRIPLAMPFAEARAKVIGPDGAFRFDDAQPAEGDALTVALPTGEITLARVLFELADTDFAAVMDVLDGGLVRFAFETFTGQPELWIWAFSWQLAEHELAGKVKPWFDTVERKLTQR